MKSIFEYDDYQKFLADYLKSQKRGGKLHLSHVMGCQPGYISQILSGDANLSAEQAERLSSHLGWNSSSTQYFLTLVAFARAGTVGLRGHFKSELTRMRSHAQVLKHRFKPEKVLSVEDQATFYSSWNYGALHVCVSIPGCQTENEISKYFQLPLKRVNEVIQFLTRVGLVKKSTQGQLSIGKSQIYIGADSPLIAKHHANWRIKGIESLDRYDDEHLHYSSVISVAETDVNQIREIMIHTIEKIRSIVRESKDEKCYSYCLDLFEVGRAE